jgi:hypothetical protein
MDPDTAWLIFGNNTKRFVLEDGRLHVPTVASTFGLSTTSLEFNSIVVRGASKQQL